MNLECKFYVKYFLFIQIQYSLHILMIFIILPRYSTFIQQFSIIFIFIFIIQRREIKFISSLFHLWFNFGQNKLTNMYYISIINHS